MWCGKDRLGGVEAAGLWTAELLSWMLVGAVVRLIWAPDPRPGKAGRHLPADVARRG